MSQSAGPPPVAPPPQGASSGEWDLGGVWSGVRLLLPAAAVAAVVVGVVLDAAAVWAVVLGSALVAVFFVVSGVVVAWAGRNLGDSATLPAALAAFGVKILVLYTLLPVLSGTTAIDLQVFGWTVVVGVVAWGIVHARWVWTARIPAIPAPSRPPTATD